MDYLAADPNTPAPGGYHGANFFRADLHDAQQWTYISAGTLGITPGFVNNIVIDNPSAIIVSSNTVVRTFFVVSNSTPIFQGSGSGTDTNSFGTNYVTLPKGIGLGYARFTPNIVVPGDYTLYQWHPFRADASASVPFIVTHNGGSTTVYANQQTNDSNWSLLGTFNFAAGTSGNVRITDAVAEPGAVAIADGLKLAFVPPTAPPAAPSGLAATAVSSSQISLTWSNNAVNVVNNVVARSTVNGGPYIDIASLPLSSTGYSDTGLAAATPYYYVVRAVNPAGPSANSAQAGATTLAAPPTPPTIVTQPQSQTVPAGVDATFSVTANGTTPLSYQWRLNGASVPGATASAYTRANVQGGDAGSYSVAVTNIMGGVLSADAMLTVVTQATFSLTVNVGSNGSVTISPNQPSYSAGTVVTVTATPNAGYNFSGWSGGIISTANPLLVTMTSDIAITASFAPSPSDIIMDNTDPNVTFIGAWSTGTMSSGKYGPDYRFASTAAGGTSVATYRPNITVPGIYTISALYTAGSNRATNAPYTIQTDGSLFQTTLNQQLYNGIWVPLLYASAHLSPGGSNYVLLSNDTGYSGKVVIADAVRFQLYQADAAGPVITSQPASQVVTAGSAVTFSVAATGALPLSYYWQRNGLPVAGATDSSYTTDNVQLADSGSQFSCLVSNAYGNVLSSNAVLTVVTNTGLVFAADFESGLQGFTIDNTYGSANGLWHLSTGRGLDPGHSPSHSLYYGHNEGVTGGGNYDTGTVNGGVVVSPTINLPPGSGSIFLSFNYLMDAEIGTTFDVGFVDVTTDNGASYVTVVSKDAFGGLTSVTGGLWVSNKVDLSPYAGSSIKLRFRFDTVDPLYNTLEGWYLDDIVVTALGQAPAITGQPQSVTNVAGTAATFNVTASGTPPLSYLWERNGVPIAGASASSYMANNVQLADSGSEFSCLVSNIYGAALSSNAVLTVTPPLPCAAPPVGLVSWWRGEGSTSDVVGGNNGTVAGSGTFGYGAGVVGQVFVFDGIHRDRVDVGNPTSLQLQDFTVEAWIKRSSLTDISLDDDNQDGAVAGEGGIVFGYGRNGYGFGLLNNGQLILSKIDVDGILSTGTVSDTSWHHVAATKSGSTTVFYIDGAPASDAIPYTTTYTFDTSASIGSRGDARGGTFWGMGDEPSVYSRGLSGAEILAIYTAGAGGKCTAPTPPAILLEPTNQVATVSDNISFSVLASGTQPLLYQWRFNGTNLAAATVSSLVLTNVQVANAGSYSVFVSNSVGTILSSNALLTVNSPPPCAPPPPGLVSWWRGEGNALDQAGGTNGILFNGVSFGAGVVGQAFNFDASSHSYMEVADSPALRLTNALTIECWAKRLNTAQVHVLADKGGDWTGGQTDFEIGLNDTDSVGSHFGFAFAGGWRGCAVTPDTAWHHYAAVAVNGHANPILYIDGVPQAITYGGGPAAMNLLASTRPLEIGAQVDSQTGWYYYSSTMIDELAIFNRALSASEIQAIYNAGSAGKCMAPTAPVILLQPTNQIAVAGDNITFSVLAAGTRSP